MSTYHSVREISHAASTIVTDNVATRRATPVRNGLKTILLHPAIQGTASQAQRLRGPADVALVGLEDARNRVLLDVVQPVRFGKDALNRRAARSEAPAPVSF